MHVLNEHGVDVTSNEKLEQDLADTYINDDDVVLELGARYGAVSCTINSKLKIKTNQVVVEPDDDNSNIPCYTLQSIKDASELTCEFNVLVADCEGGLEI
jgi:hypothetical protein